MSHLLYLDFDGVLHPEDVYFHPARGVYLSRISETRRHTLFVHAPLLVSVLAPYPDVQIVLSTSWVQHRSYSKALKRLPVSLQARVIGATFHDGHMSRDNWFALSRGAQVLGDVARRRPAHWVALDDDDVDWPEKHLSKLVKTTPMLGLSRPGAVDELRSHLDSWFAGAVPPAARTTQDAMTALTEALGGQFVSDSALDEALGVMPTPRRLQED